MRVGEQVQTLPTVRPGKYAGKVGTVTTFNDGEVQVQVGGSLAWFRPDELQPASAPQELIPGPIPAPRHSDTRGGGSAAPRPAQPASELTLGARGPGGGIVARCVACGGLWERERRRGRPVQVCPNCAK